MPTKAQQSILLGDQVEVTTTSKGGFLNSRYLATVIGKAWNGRIRVRDEEGREQVPFLSRVRKLDRS